MSAATKPTSKKRRAFLAHLAKHGNVSAAALASGMKRCSWYDLRAKDAEFAKQWEDAVEIATDLLILEAKRRAYKGTRKPVFYQGVKCGAVREYSDSLMMFLIKAKKPEYREKTDINVNGEINIRELPDDQLESRLIVALGKDRAFAATLGAGTASGEEEN